MPPIIGITTAVRPVKSSAGTSPTHTLNRAYTSAIERTGGVPLLFPSVEPELAGTLLDLVDGLVLSGGGDVEPRLYGGIEHETVYDLDPRRDAFEMALIREARERRTPVLAICRGMQVANVAFGGTLIEDIPSGVERSQDHHRTGDEVFETPIRLRVEPGCSLDRLLGPDPAVNSIHHQAVRVVAPSMRAVAWGDDGIIEAIESTEPWSMIGVQWHPEFLVEKGDPGALRLFEGLVAASS